MNRIVFPLPLPVTGPLLWLLKKIIENLPAIILPQVLALLDQVMDPRTPAWRRAAIAAVLLELVSLLNAAVPVGVICRFLVLNAAFGQQPSASRNEAHDQPAPTSD